MVNLIIPCKNSQRFPHKNAELVHYTIRWLREAVNLCDKTEDVRLIVVGQEDEIQEVFHDCPLPYEVVLTPAVNMQDDLTLVADTFEAEVNVLLQLTQPVREASLLKRALDQFRKNGKTIISATRVRDDRWRAVDINGVWYPKTDGTILMHDGCIYLWRQGKTHEIFERTCPHDVVISSETLPVIDIDRVSDVPLDLWLLSQWALVH